MLKEIMIEGYERVVAVHAPEIGLEGYIAVHSTRLGPSAGGLRLRAYDSSDAALQDALKLARGMSFKNAAAGLPLGGGKAVIRSTPAEMTRARWLAFGDAVASLNGAYWTAEDMGVTPADLAVVAERAPYVAGLENGAYASGDPSPHTARGVYECLVETLKWTSVSPQIQGKRVAVQGLGHVGWRLCALLADAGAALTVADIDAGAAARAEEAFGAARADVSAIHAVEADVFAPCAVGGVLNEKTIPEIRALAVVGAANNQLATPEDAERLAEAGILYAPDYIVNSGGIINVATEVLKIENREAWVRERLASIAPTLAEVFQKAGQDGAPPSEAADRLIAARLGLEA